MRAHLYKAITDIHGDVQNGTVVRILQPDAVPASAVLITNTVFTKKIGATEAGSTFTVDDGIIDVWLDTSQYVMLGMTPPGQQELFIDNVAVFAPSVPGGSGGSNGPLWVHTLTQDLVSNNGSSSAFEAAIWLDGQAVYGDIAGELAGGSKYITLLDPLTDPLLGGTIASVQLTYDVTWTANPGAVVAIMNPYFSLAPVVPSGTVSPFGIYNDLTGLWASHGEVSMPPQRFDAGPSTGFEAGLMWENTAPATGQLVATVTKWARIPYRSGWGG
jgi:hypothetical protein